MGPDDVLEGVLEQAKGFPGHPAVKGPGRELSYRELREETEIFASALAAKGVGEGERVCLHLPNSVDFVVAALACLWRGAVFVPLATTDPPARLQVVLDDCCPSLVITSGTEGANLPEAASGPWPQVTMAALRQSGSAPFAPRPAANVVAYAIYTSGTTGSPKGVLIGRRAFAAAVRSTANAVGISSVTRALCVSPFHFDGSYGTLFPTLYRGGTVVLRPREALMFPRVFFNAVHQEGINFTSFSPSYLRILLSDPRVATLEGSTLRSVAIGGEASSLADLEALWSAVPSVEVFNRYGPTECTIAVSHMLLNARTTSGGSVPIGTPHPGVSFYVFDDHGQRADEVGHVGELYIGGVQLMEGYWGAPALTAEVMRSDLVPGQLLYRTGDLVYRSSSGNYVYVGRVGTVIKRRGVRLSLVELSETMRHLPGVTAATCTVFDDDGSTGIAAFVVVSGEEQMTASELRALAASRLPEPMLPDLVEIVPAMPLTGSNKLDEQALLAAAGLRSPSR